MTFGGLTRVYTPVLDFSYCRNFRYMSRAFGVIGKCWFARSKQVDASYPFENQFKYSILFKPTVISPCALSSFSVFTLLHSSHCQLLLLHEALRLERPALRLLDEWCVVIGYFVALRCNSSAQLSCDILRDVVQKLRNVTFVTIIIKNVVK